MFLRIIKVIGLILLIVAEIAFWLFCIVAMCGGGACDVVGYQASAWYQFWLWGMPLIFLGIDILVIYLASREREKNARNDNDEKREIVMNFGDDNEKQ